MQNLRDIAFEEIVSGYSRGRYGDFEVIIQMATGYVNVTDLCSRAVSRNGEAKQFAHWRALHTSDEYIDAVARSLVITRDQVVIKVLNAPNELKGSYAHPKLVPHIASWASVDFAIKVADIVNAHLVREYQATIGQKDATILKLQADMDRQTQMIEQLLRRTNGIATQNDEIKEELTDAHVKLDTAHTDLAATHARLEQTQETVVAIATKLGVAVERRVPPSQPGKEEVVAIYAKKRPYPNAYDEMRATRCQECNLAKQVEALAKKGYVELVVKVDPTPNARGLWNQMSTKLASEVTGGRYPRVYSISGQHFKTRSIGPDAYGREGIAKMLLDMDAEKRNV